MNYDHHRPAKQHFLIWMLTPKKTIEFPEKAWFFSDFLLDEILVVNPLPRLETFVIKNAAMTLISALRMLNSRPKLKTIGHILQWDVEISELDTFGQIIKRAKSLNLLHDVTFL